MTFNEYSKECYQTAKDHGFWDMNLYLLTVPTKIALIMSELGEALEADRKGDNEHLAEEIADTFIRLFDLCGYLNLDIEEIINKKMEVNKNRPFRHNKRY